MNDAEITEFRAVGHGLIDLIADYLRDMEERPLFTKASPAEIEGLFDESVPRRGREAREVIEELKERLLPHCTHVSHPGYFGLITPSPAPMGILGDLLASALNQNVGAWTIGPSATALERRCVRWLDDLIGFGPGAGGNLTSGGTMANFIALKLARDRVSGDRAQHEGVRGRWRVYVSEERHVCMDKAVDAIGIGREGLQVLPTDAAFRVSLDSLEEAIARDKAEGIRPLCVIGIAGTTNTGSIDPLAELRRIADREGMWFHVDACYGGGLLLSEEGRSLLAGVERADSVALDPHKWFYAPLDAGAVLVRDENRLTASFGMKPSYLTDEMDPEGHRYQYYVHGFEQSRRFRALKVWMSFKRYGTVEMGRWVDANRAHARRLHELAEAHPSFESAVEPRMSAVCLRYVTPGLSEAEAAALHRRVARRVEEEGRFWISTTELKGRTWFRVNPVNLRTRSEHMDALLADLEALCRKDSAAAD